MRIDWNLFPCDANWVAMDADGGWWGYTERPEKNPDRWTEGGGDLCSLENVIYDRNVNWSGGAHWDETLTQRPTKEEPMKMNLPASPDDAIRMVIDIIAELRALKCDELDNSISSLKNALYMLSTKL